MKKVVVIGAGPAGLTAAYELKVKNTDYDVIVLEETDRIGGISRTVNHNGNRMDMGGHRFFSKIPEVNAWWNEIMPMQTEPSMDDAIMERDSVSLFLNSQNVLSCDDISIDNIKHDPEKEDNVMLFRRRVSRILFDDKFYDYPINFSRNTFMNLGIINTIKVAFSYLVSMFHKLPENNLENFYINRFGKKLYSLFFEYYTENLWGRHPREIDAAWGGQRVKGLSIITIFLDVIGKVFKVKKREVETSLIEEFKYPKYGPGQLWERAAAIIEKHGGEILKNAKVIGVNKESDKGKITSVTYIMDGKKYEIKADYVISSMPIRDLILGMNDVPLQLKNIAQNLPYRDYMTLGVLVPKLKLYNKTNLKTVANIIPDCWIYIQDKRVRLGRMQIYNNWSPYMVKDINNTVWIGLEYFVNEGDEFWNMSDESFTNYVINEMLEIGIIDNAYDVIDTHLEHVKKAYPAYFDSYIEIDKVIDYLKSISNLYCVGRNGQHRYNNMDHSMITAFEAVKLINSGSIDQTALWNVNTEKEYHEESKI